MIRVFLLLYILSFTLMAKGQLLLGMESPKYESRAVWLTTIGGIDWPHSYAQSSRTIQKQQEELCTILDQLQQAGVNQVLLQTRIRATTLYPSSLEPWDGCLSGIPGKSPGYDALAFAIDECHRRGMGLHAWIVTIPIGKWESAGCRQLRKRYPAIVKRIGPDGFMNPEKAQTAHYLADLCEEITRKYDVDGIHLDYIRYPATWKLKVSAHQGRQYITHIVETIYQRVKAIKPYVKLSCAPIGKHDDLARYSSFGWNAFSRVCQDVQGWLRQGLMDQIFPMMYFRGQQFYPFAIDWHEQSCGRIITPGLGIYMLDPREKDWSLDVVTREMSLLRQYGMGHAYFRSRFLTNNVKGIYDYVCHFDRTPALVPPMTWATSHRPAAPTALENKQGILSWQHEGRAHGDTLYNIYASDKYPVDTERGEHLIAAKVRNTTITLPAQGRQPWFYAVTATNRYGIESAACQQAPPPPHPAATVHMLACEGRWLTLPSRPSDVKDNTLLVVEDAYGRQVKVIPWKGERTDVSTLENGIYRLRSINTAGRSHHWGFFRISR